jgi:hypothetical protein
VEAQFTALAAAHAALNDALSRTYASLSSGSEALIGIERLRLENCTDLYWACAADIKTAFHAFEEQEQGAWDDEGTLTGTIVECRS